MSYPIVPSIVITLFTIIFLTTVESMVEEWLDSGAYSHGFLALAFSAFLIHQKREYLTHSTNEFRATAILATAFFGFLWFLGTLGGILAVQVLAVVAILNSIFLATYGWSVYRKVFFFPLCSLFLIVPIWNFLSSPLQILSVVVTANVIPLTGTPFFLEGFSITVPGGKFLVEEACSGLGFLLTSALLGLYFGYINTLTLRSTVIFFFITISISIFANWIRIISIILVGNYTQMQHAIVSDHLTFGWILFSCAIAPMLYFGDRLTTRRLSEKQHSQPTIESIPKMLLPLVVMSIFPLMNLIGTNFESDYAYDLQPPTLQGYTVTTVTKTDWEPDYHGYDSMHFATFQNDANEFDVVMINYTKQSQGKELVFFANKSYDSRRWMQIDQSPDDPLGYIIIKNRFGDRRIVLYWYLVGGYQTGNKYLSKLLQIYGRLMGINGASAIVVSGKIPARTDNPFKKETREFVIKLQNTMSERNGFIRVGF